MQIPDQYASPTPFKGTVEELEKHLKAEKGQRPEPTEDQETTPSAEANNGAASPSASHSEGEYSGSDAEERETGIPDKPAVDGAQPPLPNEPLPDEAPPLPNEPLPSDPAAPPLPAEPVPEPEDDGWEFHWNPNDQSYWFYNRFTGVWQKENPRVPTATTIPTTTTTIVPSTSIIPAPAAPGTDPQQTILSNPTSIAGGYNPAIHGDYDENAWYAQPFRPTTTTTYPGADQLQDQHPEYITAAYFNRHTGQWQTPDQAPERHSDEAKARRQMRAFFDVDAAANMHDGRSLKAERSGIKPTKAELKAFKERRRAKKEEKRRAWLRD
ncbi:hypothetical protein N657DRAFT_656282 [Parathielavia appendiculata]|uniref:WW domain-containing protein n=1 Tax=Parathielavia appendiculata TaxID=2587402 RepID=A0AAN6Z3K1_9PEZI|nr:hypothetical protein N657DRAFT_656282 [Parathielavia appendiculata]